MSSDLKYLRKNFYKGAGTFIKENEQIPDFDYKESKRVLALLYKDCIESYSYPTLISSMCVLAFNCFLLEAQHNIYQYTTQDNPKSTPEDYMNCAKDKIRTAYLLFIYNRKFQELSNVFYNFLALSAKIDKQKYTSLWYTCFSTFLTTRKNTHEGVTLKMKKHMEDFLALHN